MTNPPDQALIDLSSAYVPLQKWFPRSHSGRVVIDIYRVYKEPFANRVIFPSALQVIDFDPAKARAVFLYTRFMMPDYESGYREFPTPEGDVQFGPQRSWVVLEHEEFMQSTQREIWHDSEEGVFLLILTPSLTKSGPEAEDELKPAPYAVEMTLDLVRGALILNMGRNAAFEQVFRAQIYLEPERRGLNALTTMRDDPRSYDKPKLNGFTAEDSEQLVRKILESDEDTRNRVSLALRWYLRAQRHPIPTGELAIDLFVYYWVAFEALAMPNEDYRSALRRLAEIHARTMEEVKAAFPIGRLHGLRSRILHRGEVYPLDRRLSAFMDALCVDVMMHLLGIEKEPRTAAYLDGSANGLLPRITKSYRLPQERDG